VPVLLERHGQRIDGLLGDEDVALGRVAVTRAAAGPVVARVPRERGRVAMPVDDAHLPLGAAVVRGRERFDYLRRRASFT